jgi:hypothetical protein
MHLLHDGRRWPLPGEQVDEYTAVLALERAGALHIAGHYLRQRLTALQPLNKFGHQALPHGQVTVSARVARSVEELDACFVVKDSAGQKLAYVYFEEEPGRRSAAKLPNCSPKTRRGGPRGEYRQAGGAGAKAVHARRRRIGGAKNFLRCH